MDEDDNGQFRLERVKEYDPHTIIRSVWSHSITNMNNFPPLEEVVGRGSKIQLEVGDFF